MNKPSGIDGWMLMMFTKGAHLFQRITGKNNFFLAKMMATLTIIISATEVLNYVFPVIYPKTSLFSCFLSGSIIALLIVNFMFAEREEGNSDVSEVTAMNWRAVDPSEIQIRAFTLGLTLGLVLLAVMKVRASSPKTLESINVLVSMWGITAYYYFMAVTPLPPSKSLLKQLIEKLSFQSADPALVKS